MDIPIATQWFKMAAMRGHAGAQYSLALIYFNTPGKELEAKALLDSLAAQHYHFAEYEVGVYCNIGDNWYPEDQSMAKLFYERVALQNHSLAQHNLFRMLVVHENMPLAMFWLRLSAANETEATIQMSTPELSQFENRLSLKCAGCQREADPLERLSLRCSACQSPHFCNKNCPKIHWKNGHKLESKQVSARCEERNVKVCSSE